MRLRLPDDGPRRAAGQDRSGVLGLLGEAVAQDPTNLSVRARALPHVLGNPVAALVVGAAGGRALPGQWPGAGREAPGGQEEAGGATMR